MATQFTASMINAILTAFSCVMVYHFALERLNFCSSTDCFRSDIIKGITMCGLKICLSQAMRKGDLEADLLLVSMESCFLQESHSSYTIH
jgi:hypothetical protein